MLVPATFFGIKYCGFNKTLLFILMQSLLLVDQTLLETPEEEMRFLPFKDMILLAEHREQLVVCALFLAFWHGLYLFFFLIFSNL